MVPDWPSRESPQTSYQRGREMEEGLTSALRNQLGEVAGENPVGTCQRINRRRSFNVFSVQTCADFLNTV